MQYITEKLRPSQGSGAMQMDKRDVENMVARLQSTLMQDVPPMPTVPMQETPIEVDRGRTPHDSEEEEEPMSEAVYQKELARLRRAVHPTGYKRRYVKTKVPSRR